MGYDLAISGLLRKRAELAGEIEGLRVQLQGRADALRHIDAAILVFKPDLELEDMPEGIPPVPFAGFRGEIQRFLLGALREANAPQTTFDLADGIMRKRGLDPDDRVALSLIRKRTGYALAKLRKAGKVTSWRAHRSAPLAWAISCPNAAER